MANSYQADDWRAAVRNRNCCGLDQGLEEGWIDRARYSVRVIAPRVIKIIQAIGTSKLSVAPQTGGFGNNLSYPFEHEGRSCLARMRQPQF